MPKNKMLTIEEIHRLAKIFISLGVEKIRLTGSSLDDASAKALSNALMHGSKLKSLEISNNRTIGTEGWKAIFRSLPHCSLEDLDVGCQVSIIALRYNL